MHLGSISIIQPAFKVLFFLRRKAGRRYMALVHRLYGVKKNRVYFSSFAGRSYSDSPARISEALHALRPDAELVWQLRRGADAPDYVRVVRPHSLGALRAISTSRCLVDNFNRKKYMQKFPDQKYVQTWHGDRGFKKMLYDMEDGTDFPDGEQMDLGVSGSDFGTKNYRTAFRYNGEVMQLGIPRNDALIRADAAQIARIRERLGIPEGTKALLYAPTFRDETVGGEQPAGFSLGRALDRLEAATGAPWVCLTRAHSHNLRVHGDGDARVRDVSKWPETSELLLAADMLITDYSSTAGDYVLLDRPVILYQADLARFISTNRHMYFDLRKCPYACAESEEQLLSLLDDIDALVPRCAMVRDFYGVTETGHSTEAVAQWIADVLEQDTSGNARVIRRDESD